LVAHFSELSCLFSHYFDVLASFVAECTKQYNDLKFRHLVFLANQEVHQFLIKIKEGTYKLGITRITHPKIAPFKDNV